MGQGNVLLFGNDPIYRGEIVGTYGLAFNAILEPRPPGARRDTGETVDRRTAIGPDRTQNSKEFAAIGTFREPPFCVMLSSMGSKDKGKKEVKKAPKPKPKPEPGRKREVFTPAPPK